MPLVPLAVPSCLRSPAVALGRRAQVRERIRYDHCGLKTKKSDVHWVQRFVRFQAAQFRARRCQLGLALMSTMICMHVPAASAAGLASPLDSLRCGEPAADLH